MTGQTITFDTAQSLVRVGVSYGDVFPLLTPEDHEQFHEWFLHEPGVPNLIARKAQTLPASGNGCPKCGAPLIRDGKCELCPSCGETVGSCS